MAVLQMQRISICALKKDRKAILEQLQNMGLMEIAPVLDEDSDFQRTDTGNARGRFEKIVANADQALDILQMYAPQKKSFLSGLEGKTLIEKNLYEQDSERRDAVIRLIHQITEKNKEIAEHKAEILKLENQTESLAPWLSLDIPMNFHGTNSTALLLGSMPDSMTLEQLYAFAAEQAPDLEALDIHIISADKDASYIAVLCLKKEVEKVEEAFRAGGFAKPSQAVTMVPAKAKENLEEQIKQLNQKIKKMEEEIKSFGESREDIRLISDYFRVRADKYEVLGEIPQSQKTFVISGYAPAKVVPAIEKEFRENYDLVLDIVDIQEEEEAPVLLHNNQFSESVEGVLASYGLPGKGEIDPTTVMSFFYVFLFGLMLSDAAYGFLMFAGCAVLIKKFPRMGNSMKKSLRMFMYCGISTLVWGILFGGYFGDAVAVAAETFFYTEITIPALWFVPLDDPMRMLVYSMLFGVIHLFTGLFMKGYMLIKDKKYLDCFCDVGLWLLMLVGLIIMLIPSDIFASIAQAKITLPAVINSFGKCAAIGGAIGILLMSGRTSKNIAARLALGAYDLYNVTGWLSDVLSYSRLLALGLATGVIASVINQMGSMVGSSVFGVIVFIAVFIFGHAFNMAINILGAYVHTNRLQFVEFFGKFYEGGGKAFRPFQLNTKYVDVKEETYL